MSEVAGTGTPAVDGGGEGSSDGGSIEAVSGEGLAEALAAAKEALSAGDPEAEVTDLASSLAPKEPAKAEAEDPDKLLDSVEKTLAKRRAEAQEKLKLRQEFEKERVKLDSERSQLLQQQKELQEAARYIKQLKDNPAEAIRMLGIEPEDFIADLANAGTPEYKQKSEMQKYQDELARLKAQLSQREEYERQAQEQYRQQYAIQAKQTAEHQFLQTALSDDFPTLGKLFQGHRQKFLLEEANEVAEEYYQATNKVADFRDIAQYLEEQYAMSVGVSKPTQGKPAPGKRGAVTLGSISSERSTGFDPSEDDSDADAVKKAIAATRNELKKFAG
jgi:hypothetical protein